MIARVASAALLALAACGADPSPPTIRELRIEPVDGVAPGDPVALTVAFEDLDGDLLGGRAEIALRRQVEPRGTRHERDLADGGATRGTLTFTKSPSKTVSLSLNI